MNKTEQIKRISAMEQCFEQAKQAMARLSAALDEYAEAETALRRLREYYGSEAWKRDFAADEKGLLPPNLKRGVLSEDGIWNLLSDWRDVQARSKER